jgi:uncharacterized protein (TIGR02246 family)
MFKKTLMAAVLTGCLAASSAFASDADILREAKDRADIAQLMWNYCRALDSLNADAYASVFTEDGEFVSGGAIASSKGHDALKKIVTDVKKSQAERAAKGEKITPMHHIITNSTIEFVDKDHVRYHSYWMTAFAGVGREIAPRVAAVGRGVDDIVRVNGKWLIKKRNVAPKD